MSTATLNKLTAASVKAATYTDKSYKLFDGGGLFLHVQRSGRYWRLKYRWGKKERLLALGVYPTVSLAKAREKRNEARALIQDGIDPSQHRRAEKKARRNPDTFKAVAGEWLAKQQTVLSEGTRSLAERRFELWVFPHIGDSPLTEIEAPELLSLLQRIEKAGKHDTAHRVRQRISQVFRYAIATGRASRDPAADLKGALAPVPTQHRAAITDPDQVATLLCAIEGHEGQYTTRAALQLMALLFPRPGELRKAEWPEFDLEAAVWRVPQERMKMRREHVVPLSNQAVHILRELHPITGHRRFVFEAVRAGRPLSENTLNVALKTLGYSSDQMTTHGFRALASTLLHEQGWPPEVIELQLAHAQKSQVAAAYNRSARLEERRRMMQAWADYLDGLRRGRA